MIVVQNEGQLAERERSYVRDTRKRLLAETRHDIASGSQYVATRFGDTWVVSFNFDGRIYTQEVTR